jgi:3-carboxy-cis,cis-muconate cycloisomerase
VQGRLGIIPAEAAREIERKCRVENIDFAKLKATTERIGYPILGVVQQIVALCEKGLGEWCHWGATTQDITDTATIMQIRAALALVEADMEKTPPRLPILAQRYRDTPMAGRAICSRRCRSRSASRRRRCRPAMQRHRERLAQLRPRVLVGEFAGAAPARFPRSVPTASGAGGANGGAWPRPAGDRGHTVRDRIARSAVFLASSPARLESWPWM